MNSRDEGEKTFKVAMPDAAYSIVYLRDVMSVEEFLASACARRNLNPMEHFVRVKKRRDMEDHNYFVPHRNDLIENYVSPATTFLLLLHINRPLTVKREKQKNKTQKTKTKHFANHSI